MPSTCMVLLELHAYRSTRMKVCSLSFSLPACSCSTCMVPLKLHAGREKCLEPKCILPRVLAEVYMGAFESGGCGDATASWRLGSIMD
ncbi:hypothetical protein L3X38_024557 [Prunus dulcis]|uniref:Uncharacterized protein n=1 Tax=Prunus dulcis TaxID=3755 RepID=A0AAD4W012_PRUDU|nr:hypothetical protein L3X38_024557 [Prunus dulcis]